MPEITQTDFWTPAVIVAAITALIAAIGVSIALIAAVFNGLGRIVDWRTHKIRAKGFGSERFGQETIDRSTRYYVEPDCSNVDPAGGADMRGVFAPKQKLFKMMDEFLDRNSRYQHMILMVDSGMGKTSCLLNYYAKNQRKRRGRHTIAITPLRDDSDAYIKSIIEEHNPRDLVMFLDAFDEDPQTIKDHGPRLMELLDLCRDFRRVIISSRTQFFPKDEEIPTRTGILRQGPTELEQSSGYELRKLYLSPLSSRQERKFIRKRYPFWRQLSRWKMRRRVRSIHELATRPMLLAALPEFLNRKDLVLNDSIDLYEALIEAWYTREDYWVPPNDLREFSSRLALDLYINSQNRGRETIPRKEIGTLARQWNIDVEGWRHSGRSLLNRDAVGDYKFAHRAVMEYLVVKQLLSGEAETYDLKLTDQMEQFFSQMLTDHPFWQRNFIYLELSERLKLIEYAPPSANGRRFAERNRRNLREYYLVKADLHGANLESAGLGNATLNGANLAGPTCLGPNCSGQSCRRPT